MSDVSKGAREEIRVPGRAEPLGRFYTDAVRAGDFVFISGQAGVDENRKIVARNDAGAQCRQTLENMGAVLAAAGGGFKDVVMVTVYLKNMDDRSSIAPVREEFFAAAKPASTLIEVTDFAIEGMLIEIDAVAYLPR